MAYQFHLPDIGEGVVEGEVVQWKVKEGDRIELDQPMVEIMTDKATVEIPSPRAGIISRINYGEGKICPVGAVLVEIDEGGAARKGGNGHAAAPAPDAAPKAAAPKAPAVPPTPSVPAAPGARVLATPATRRLARQLDVDLQAVAPSGQRGRVTSDDVRKHSEGGAATPAPARATPAAARAPLAIAPAGAGQEEERIPFRGIRKKIADNMVRSKFTATHFTYVEEVDMTDLVALRGRAKARAAERGVKLTYLPFIIKAVVAGLKKWPALNAALDEASQEIVRKKYYHVGLAAQGPQGLVVTVVRDADHRSLFDLAREIERLADAVKGGTATRDDLTGSTFTISSLGQLGGVLATPIINFPEVGIVGVHKIAERPAVHQGAIVARWLMNLSISLDHRLVDGYDGAMFLQEVKSLLEDPTLMFMEMV